MDVTRFVHLTDITQTPRRTEAFLYDRYNNRHTRLRVEGGFDSFRVSDNYDDTLVRGKVIRIDEREVIFVADAKYYRLPVGESVYEAMRKPLSTQELKELKLAAK